MRFFQGYFYGVAEMHYYQFHVSDYLHDTAHLSIEEDLAFRRLLDLYYTQEKPIPNKTREVARRIRMSKYENAVQTVLEEFFMFDMEKDQWFHARCDKTIADYQAKAERNRTVGKLGGRPKNNPEETQTVSKQNPNHKPITINQEPVKKTQRGSRLPADWVPDSDLAEWSKAERPDLELRKVLMEFRDYWIAQPGQKGVKLDWNATWRNWVRNQKAIKQTFAQQAADVIRMTVPGSKELDPALKKIEEDRSKAAPPPADFRALVANIKGALK